MPSWIYASSLATLIATQALASPLESRAVDYSVPSSWRSPTTSRTAANRKSISKAAVQRMIKYKGSYSNQNIANMNYWPSANVWTEVVMHDFDAGTQDFKGVSLDAVGDTYGQHNAFHANEYNDDTLWWGFAAIYQYRTYGDTTALTWAKNNWADVAKQQVKGTSGNGKNFSWNASCNGKSTLGGVFWKTSADANYVNGITTGLFMASSAHLYEITGEAKYLDAAKSARSYIRNHLINAKGLVQDGLNVQNCAITNWVFTYNQGKYIEALAMLYGKTGNADFLNEAVGIAVTSMKNTNFQGNDGIITEGQAKPYDQNNDARNFKGVYLRALAILYRKAPTGHGIKNLIRAYINVQANALIDLASDNPSNPVNYAVNWHGPKDAGYPWGQLSALDALEGFISVN